MKRLSRTGAVVAVLLLTVSTGIAEETGKPVPETVLSLNPVLQGVLKKKYPGHRLATKADYPDYLDGDDVPSGPGYQWSYGALKADFNGDGLEDYTLIIRHKRFFLWLTALRQGDSYKIDDFGTAAVLTEDDPPLRSQKKAGLLLTIGPPGGLKQDQVPLNPFPYIHLIGDGDCIEAYWKDGVWIHNSFVD